MNLVGGLIDRGRQRLPLFSCEEKGSMDTEEDKSLGFYVKAADRRYRCAEPELILEAARQIVSRRTRRGEVLRSPTVAGAFFEERLAGYEREVFAVALLDTRHRLIKYAELFQGTVDSAEVHPREIARMALRHNAAAVIAGHNHPSGDTQPSAADRAVTARLKQALALIDVRLLDHFVVGMGGSQSMAALGWV
jgi:DNA repair protein RadC